MKEMYVGWIPDTRRGGTMQLRKTISSASGATIKSRNLAQGAASLPCRVDHVGKMRDRMNQRIYVVHENGDLLLLNIPDDDDGDDCGVTGEESDESVNATTWALSKIATMEPAYNTTT